MQQQDIPWPLIIAVLLALLILWLCFLASHDAKHPKGRYPAINPHLATWQDGYDWFTLSIDDLMQRSARYDIYEACHLIAKDMPQQEKCAFDTGAWVAHDEHVRLYIHQSCSTPEGAAKLWAAAGHFQD